MSTLAIVLIVLAVVIVLLFIGGLAAARRRERSEAPVFHRHLQEADRALEAARAGDRGWDPAVLERTVQETLARSHPHMGFDQVVLVLVDDQPGVLADRAHFEAHAGDQRVQVVLSRDEAGWRGETQV